MPRMRDATQDALTVADIEAAAGANDIPRAAEMARAALADGLIHPLLLNLRAHWWEQQGRKTEALEDLRHAFALAPLDLFVRNAYGMLLGKLERWSEALPILRETVSLAPDYAGAYYRLGWALEQTGELDEARACFEKAAALDPAFVLPLPHLADFAQRRSDWVAAKDYAHRALALAPNHYVALAILASVAIAEGDLASAEALITPLLGRQPPEPREGALVRRILGDLRHAQGRYPQAFAAYTAGNRIKYAAYAPRYEKPGSTAADYVGWLTDFFKTAEPLQWSAKRDLAAEPDDPRHGAAGHVFLVGFPRSGTTLLENVLASHPDVRSIDERDTFGQLTHMFLIDDAGRNRLARLTPAGIAEHRATYWDRVAGFGGDVTGKVVVDKYPLSSIRLPLVAKLFPKARILFAVRDPRDVVLSCYRRDFAMNSSLFEFLMIDRAARFYGLVMDLSDIYRNKLALDWREVRNEALVDDFEGEAQAICAFMGLAWNEQMRDFAEHARSRTIRTPSSVQVVRGINRDSVGQWRHYAKEMEPAMPFLKRWIAGLGYDA